MFKKTIALMLVLALLAPAAALGELKNTTAKGSMTVGTTGDEVLTVEQKLQSLGYFTGTPDTAYDKETAAAVKEFQKANGLKQDGQVGDKTWARLTGLDGVPCIPKTVYDQVDPATTTGLSKNGSMIIGSKGAGVTEVQQLLQALNYYTGLIDGYYSASVSYAVRRFQERNALPVDGKVGPQTLTALRDPGAIAADTFSQGTTLNGSLTIGSTGSEVQNVQQFLLDMGFYKGPIDSVFSQETANAVKSFQLKYGLTADGVVGSDTYNALLNAHTVYMNTSTTGLTPNGSLQLGSKGAKVYDVKVRLNELEYFNGVMDETFDAELAAAVRAFQIRNNLGVDGVVGTKTWDRMFNDPEVVYKSDVVLPTLSRHGSNVKADVQALQNVLFNAYFFYGSCDGIYGADTEAAVRAFQAAAGLTVDGMAGNATRRKLLSVTTARDSVKTPPVRVLSLGDRGWDVYLLQQRLAELNYLALATVSKGVYDTATANAIATFQKHKRINTSGTYDATTRRYLWASDVDAEQQAANQEIYDAQNPYDQANIPYVGDTLKEGASGTQVAAAQMRLKAGGWLLGAADGKFGADTTAAVKRFQADYNAYVDQYNKDHASDPGFEPVSHIKVDGIIGQDTWTQLWYWDKNGTFTITNADQVVVIDGQTSVGANVVVMQRGSKGAQVVKLQTRLKDLGYYTGEIDGRYGPQTAIAVSKYQQDNGLKVDGKVGTQTLASLQLGYTEAPVVIPEKPAEPEVFTDTAMPSQLSSGSKGNSVIKLQQALQAEGLYTGTVDGYFGDSTKIAVMEYQDKYNKAYEAAHPGEKGPLPVSGVATSATLIALGLKPSASPSTSRLEVGSTGDMVKTVQQKLKDGGYYTGDVNGIFDNDTQKAVKAFQKASGLKQDGIVGSQTWKALTGTYMGGGTLPETVTVMRRGSKGGNVFQLQSFLVDKGYLAATLEGKSSVDGKFGPATAVAVMKYQQAKGMEKLDGIVGAATYAKMKDDGLLSYPTK